MIRYEVLLLSIPEVTQDEAQRLESQLGQVIRAQGGSIISFERWGKFRLAYPVNRNDYGVYFLARFEVATAGNIIEEIKSALRVKLQDIVVRSIIVKLEPNQTLEYQRPQSLEETSTRDSGSFFDRGPSSGRSGRGRGMRDGYRDRFDDDRSNDGRPSFGQSEGSHNDDFIEPGVISEIGQAEELVQEQNND